MKKTLKNLLLVAVVMVSALTLAGCNKEAEKKDPIIGTWDYDGDFKATYVFKEDGTGSYALGSSDAKQNITYTKDDKKIAITFGDSTVPFETEYRIEDDTLIILDSFGTEVKYKKK